jgi:MSHA biogenesis protein MshP
MSRQRGFSLIAVIFMIVVLAALGAFAVSISLSQQQTGNLALLEARTAAAAQAGIEYGAYLASTGTCVASQPLPLPGGALNGFVVTVKCAQPPTNHGTSHFSYVLTATAASGTYGTPDFVSRTASLTVTTP